jgi:hypothetical protein
MILYNYHIALTSKPSDTRESKAKSEATDMANWMPQVIIERTMSVISTTADRRKILLIFKCHILMCCNTKYK